MTISRPAPAGAPLPSSVSSTVTPAGAHAPVGVFDSGVGGLSILRHIRAHLPHESLLYFADSGYAPYGDRSEAEIVARSLAIAEFLLARGAKALVVACNTATAAAIAGLRARYPSLPVVGVEPGLKPAAALSQSKTVGVLATQRTLTSIKFNTLREQVETATGVRFLIQPCVGLADRIESGELRSRETAAMVERYVVPLLAQGADTLVLGCTHYPFVQSLVERIAGDRVAIVDTSEAVARQLARLLGGAKLLGAGTLAGTLEGFTTGSASSLTTAFDRLLGLPVAVSALQTTAVVKS